MCIRDRIGAMEEEVEILKSKMTIAETEVIAGMEFYKGTFEGKDIVLSLIHI